MAGMTSTLDDYSTYIPPSVLKQFNEQIDRMESRLELRRQTLVNQFLAMVNGILATPNLPGQYYFRVAQMLDHYTQYVGSCPESSPAVLCGIGHKRF